MKDRPILFSTDMVKAILEGRKTQTRRIVKFPGDFDGKAVYDNHPFGLKYSAQDETVQRLFPKWNAGDILWVRETWIDLEDHSVGFHEYLYKADCLPDYARQIKWRPSIFMPREACRILLEVTDVRVERLSDISERNAEAEGVEILRRNQPPMAGSAAIGIYMELWESINGKGSWEKNPWVWVITFKRIS